MNVSEFLPLLSADFFTGVPDSLLRPLGDHLMRTYGTDARHHVIAANEGNAAAIAAGYHLATGKTAVVYLQNSGEGNLVNPAASLLHPDVYEIPVIYVIGWRGEPGVHDEPQHVFQGRITTQILDLMGIPYHVLEKTDTPETLREPLERMRESLESGRGFAFVVRKGALQDSGKEVYKNSYTLTREKAIRCVLSHTAKDPVIATTGKAGRELFELREETGAGHDADFLTVGSMGHCSSIALGVALQRPEQRVWCIDGDGAALMHMGALAVIAQSAPSNLVHIVINNGAHESVGGLPTAAADLRIADIAKASGYEEACTVDNLADLDRALDAACQSGKLCLIEVLCALESRENLGRPTTSPVENKQLFMRHC